MAGASSLNQNEKNGNLRFLFSRIWTLLIIFLNRKKKGKLYCGINTLKYTQTYVLMGQHQH